MDYDSGTVPHNLPTFYNQFAFFSIRRFLKPRVLLKDLKYKQISFELDENQKCILLKADSHILEVGLGSNLTDLKKALKILKQNWERGADQFGSINSLKPLQD